MWDFERNIQVSRIGQDFSSRVIVASLLMDQDSYNVKVSFYEAVMLDKEAAERDQDSVPLARHRSTFAFGARLLSRLPWQRRGGRRGGVLRYVVNSQIERALLLPGDGMDRRYPVRIVDSELGGHSRRPMWCFSRYES